MGRKRYISTEISTDLRMAELAEFGLLPLLLHSWSIPHMDDWGRITGDARQFKLLVCPGLNISISDVDSALSQIAIVGLWERYEVDGKKCISIPPERWFKHQSYINKSKRDDDSGSNFPSPDKHRRTPKNTEEHRESAVNTEEQQATAPITASFSFSSSFSSSPSKDPTTTPISEDESINPFRFYENERFGRLSSTIMTNIDKMNAMYTEEWVLKAMEEAVLYDKKYLSYVRGILERWKLTGHTEPWTLPRQQQLPQQNVHQFPSRQRTPRQQRPVLPVAQPTTTAAKALTEEEREEMRITIIKLGGSPDTIDQMATK